MNRYIVTITNVFLVEAKHPADAAVAVSETLVKGESEVGTVLEHLDGTSKVVKHETAADRLGELLGTLAPIVQGMMAESSSDAEPVTEPKPQADPGAVDVDLEDL